jgi:putative mRNA 3-end processing factor
MEHEGHKYLYTGDFKTQTDASCEQFEFVECDHLITETTFASPDYIHPDPVKEIQSLLKECNKVVVGAYSLGKAQRVTQLITKHCGHFKVYVHPDLEEYHRMYEDHGYALGDWHAFRRKDFEDDEYSAYIVPPSHFRSYSGHNVLKVFATGWQRSYYRCDKVLRVSDHADWPAVLEMVRRTKAKKVYTVHGNGKFLKEHLKETIDVKIIG